MSIAQGTEHYDYPQVTLSDRPTFADFNPAFRDIDAKLYSLITGASTDHASIEALQTGLGETNLLLASVKDTADGAKSKADTNAENITLLQTALGNTDRTVANKLDSVAIAEPYDATSGTYSIDDVVVYNGQRYRCTTAVAVAEPFDADKWTGEDVQTVLNEVKSELANISVDTVTMSTSDTCLANSAKEISFSVAAAGLTPIGVVGFSSGATNLPVVGVNIVGTDVYMDVYNPTASDITFTARVIVLYK